MANKDILYTPGRKTEEGFLGPQFEVNFKAFLAGKSNSGKSTLLFEILKTKNIFNEIFHCITYHFSEEQELFEKMKKTIPNITFIKGLPKDIKKHGNSHCLLIIDDLLAEAANSDLILDLFLKKSHHLKKSLFLLTQNLYYQGKYFRNLSLNCDYFIIFKNPRDQSQIATFSRQMFPNNSTLLSDIYTAVTYDTPYGYVYLDMTKKKKDCLRIWTNITTKRPLVFKHEF